jgi:hypothetical protein
MQQQPVDPKNRGVGKNFKFTAILEPLNLTVDSALNFVPNAKAPPELSPAAPEFGLDVL